MRAALLALLAMPLAGCLTATQEPPVEVVEGEPDGTSPTDAFLKVYVRAREGRTDVVGFDRRDWYVAGLEDELPRIARVAVEGARRLNGELLVLTVVAPGDLEGRFRYDRMGVDASRQASMDAEWDLRLEELGRDGTRWLGRAPPGILG